MGEFGAARDEQDTERVCGFDAQALAAVAARLAGVAAWRLDGARLRRTEAVAAVLRLPDDAPETLDAFLMAFPADERAGLRDAIVACRDNGCGFDREIALDPAAAPPIWVRVAATCDPANPRGGALVGLVQDVTRRRGQERALWTLANVDELTGLWNRKRFVELNAAAAGQAGAGLLLIDVDKLKDVNDTLGHGVGDVLIRGVAARIRAALGPHQEAARLGGDEFAVVVSQGADERTLAETAARILAACAEPIAAEGHMLLPSVSIGGALARPGGDADLLRGDADIALYHAKDAGRGRFVAYRPTIRSAIVARLKQVTDVGRFLDEGRVEPRYMPVVRLSDRLLCGFESLARFRVGAETHAPGRYSSAFLDPRIGHALTTRMLTVVARDLARFEARGLGFDKVGLNVTLADFQRGDLETRIERAFGEAGVAIDKLVIEVTETVFLNGETDCIARTAASLRERGIRISLDDFGTGFASLTHLRTFPLDTIKIDRSFVSRITEDKASHAIVSGLIELAARLEIDIVAEGIETPDHLRDLEALGCPFGQGYLFAPPLAFEEASRFVAATGEARRTPVAA